VPTAKRVGVLALQGDFEAHKKALEQAGAHALEVRTATELDAVDALVLPGGESTTMLKLLDEEQLFEPLQRFGRERPVFGTCAGAILLATDVLAPEQRSLGLVDITVERNGYGRQLDSRVVRLPWYGNTLEAVFIRAPIIRRIGPDVKILASWRNTPVLVEQGRHLVATFHPELTDNAQVHGLFIRKLTA
jgi:pyridoxal 5'-phosphate synthase pdxT subunit